MPYFANLMLIDAFVNLLVYMLCYSTFRSALISLLRDQCHMKFLPSSLMVNTVHPHTDLPLSNVKHDVNINKNNNNNNASHD